MITILGTTRVQIPQAGNLLTDGDTFSKEIYLGEGAVEWSEVPDDGQLEPIQAEIVE